LHIGLVLGLVKTKQRLALFDRLTFAHQDPADHAGAEGLHGLALARDHHGALHRNALVQRRQAGPEEKPTGADHRQPPAQTHEKSGVALFHSEHAHAPGFLAV
jgi:hypothetical protein